MKTLLCIALIAGLLIAFQTSPELREKLRLATSSASAQVTAHDSKNDVRLINGEMDAGVTTRLSITNTGKRGIIQIAVFLSCSEGEWSRTQNVDFDANESRDFEFFFQEPTINATNYQIHFQAIP